MKKKLDDYIITYNNWYSKQFCDETVEQLKECKYSLHEFNTPSLDAISYNNDFQITYDNISNTPVIMNRTWDVINQYIRTDINFEWCNSWQGFTSPRFNRYDSNTNMKEHCDHIHSMFDGNRRGVPILSVLTVLNDNYVGGELVFFTNKEYKLNAGDVLVFPSNFLYPHKVNTIISGERHSFVNWVW
jgi:hypothetical protein